MDALGLITCHATIYKDTTSGHIMEQIADPHGEVEDLKVEKKN
jgi:hypothetical protein